MTTKLRVPTRLAVADTQRCTGCQLCMFACTRRFGSGGLAQTSIGVRSEGGMERGFIVIVCRACPDPPCLKVCPTGALRLRRGGGVLLDAYKCLGAGCRLCQEACTIGCVFWDDKVDKPAICNHCNYCADYCPHEVFAIEVVG